MPTVELEITELASRLRETFLASDWTQEQFADLLGTSRQRVMNWIKGTNDIDLDRQLQLRIALMLDISPTEVLRLHGFDVTDDVPDEVLAADSVNRETPGYVIPFPQATRRWPQDHEPADLVA